MATRGTTKRSSSKRIIVAAIDFGTTYSGYAFSFKDEFNKDPLTIKTSETWNSSTSGLQSLKTPTVVLLDKHKQLVEFGFEAEEKYLQLVDEEEHEDYYFLRRFKMSLHTSVQKSMMNIHYKIKDENGKEVEALTVFSESIKYLKKNAEDLINKRGNETTPDDIQWVLTVPAIWSDGAKQFMRRAAEKACIKSDQLMIALEPEAASILGMHLTWKTFNESTNEVQAQRGFQNGSKYIVVDMGGGTVDITLHQVVDETSLRELAPPCGGHWGGTTVDESFFGLLKRIVGDDVFKAFAIEEHEDLIGLYRDFEVKKRAFSKKSKTMRMTVPNSLLRLMKKMHPTRNIEKEIERDSTLKGRITWSGDKLKVDSCLFTTFFHQSVNDTINAIKRVVENVPDVETILLVGGCAESPLIHNTIEEQFPNKRVVVPESAGLAVLKGAVIYGHFPTTIVSRVAKHSYGIRVYRDFIPGQHSHDKLAVFGTKTKCKDVFAVHVEKGLELREGEVQSSRRYRRLEREQTSLMFDFYTSQTKNPKYVTDPGCAPLGQLEVELRPRSKGVVVSLIFGGTELIAEGVDEVTNQKTVAKFMFLTE